jgi:flagellar basal-body rod protein FlgB
MIGALFNDPQYQAFRALMDASVARHTAIAGNIANVNTPGYQRQDTSSIFQQQLEQAISSGDAEKLKDLTPKIETDTKSPVVRADGSNVNLERELVEMAKNSAQFDVTSAMITKRYQTLRMAITGKS